MWKKDATLRTEIVWYCFRNVFHGYILTHPRISLDWTTVTPKDKAVLSLFKRHAIKAYGGVAS
jgi:hypothetical protein